MARDSRDIRFGHAVSSLGLMLILFPAVAGAGGRPRTRCRQGASGCAVSGCAAATQAAGRAPSPAPDKNAARPMGSAADAASQTAEPAGAEEERQPLQQPGAVVAVHAHEASLRDIQGIGMPPCPGLLQFLEHQHASTTGDDEKKSAAAGSQRVTKEGEEEGREQKTDGSGEEENGEGKKGEDENMTKEVGDDG